MTYRIIQCKQGDRTWFEVEKKVLFWWKKKYFVYPEVFRFICYDDAKEYILSKLPKPKPKEMKVERSVYETF